MGRCQTDKVLLAHNETGPHRLKPPTTDFFLSFFFSSSLYFSNAVILLKVVQGCACAYVILLHYGLQEVMAALKRSYHDFIPNVLHFNWIFLLCVCVRTGCI